MESKTAGSPFLNPADRRKIDDGRRGTFTILSSPYSEYRAYPEDEYQDHAQYLQDRPQDWYRTMFVRYIGGSDEDIQNQPSIYGDPERVFNVGEIYNIVAYSRVLYHEGEHLVGIQVYGLPEYYNPKFFTSDMHEDKNYDKPFKIYLENPPPEFPQLYSNDYYLLFKETSGNCIGRSLDLDYKGENFQYIDHIRVTRTEDQYPDWLKELLKNQDKPSTAVLKKPNPPKKSSLDYFNELNSDNWAKN